MDVTAYFKGFHGDLNETVPVGRCDAESLKLLMTAYKCLQKGIEQVKPGARYRDIGEEVTKVAHSRGASVVKSYCGHGIGTLFHCAPNIPHYAKNKAVGTMKEGHVFTIEPMINAGDYKDVTGPDGDGGTKDGSRGAVRTHHGGHRGRRRVAHRLGEIVAEGIPVDRRRERPGDVAAMGEPLRGRGTVSDSRVQECVTVSHVRWTGIDIQPARRRVRLRGRASVSSARVLAPLPNVVSGLGLRR